MIGASTREYDGPVRAWVAQLVERVLGKDEVTGSIPVPGSSLKRLGQYGISGGNSVVESLPSKQMVAGSNPVPRSIAAEWAGSEEFRLSSVEGTDRGACCGVRTRG